MPIVFQQPSPVGAAGAVGAAQGAAQAQQLSQRNALEAANLYAQQAARMAAIQEQSAGRFQSAAMLGAQLGERGHEAELDFANQRAREAARAGLEQMRGQFLLQRQREVNEAQLRERAIAEGELTPAEEQQLARYESGIAEVRKKVAENGLRPDQAAPLLDNLMQHVTSLRLRKQLTVEKQQNMQMQEAQRKAGFLSSLQNANAQNAAMNWDNFKVGVDQGTGDFAGWISPFDGKFIPKPEQPKEKGIDVATELRIQDTAAKIIKDQHGAAWEGYSPKQRLDLLNDEVRRVRMRMGLGGGSGGNDGENPPLNMADQAALEYQRLAERQDLDPNLKGAALSAHNEIVRMAKAVGYDLDKLSEKDAEKYRQLSALLRSLPKPPEQPKPQQTPPPAPPPAGPGEAVPGLSTGFGPADFIRRQIGA